MVKYNLVSVGDTSNITVVYQGEMYVADNTHPNFKAIVAAAVAADPSVVDLFDIAKTAGVKFSKISDRVSVAHGQVYFDGEVVDNALANQILRFMQEGVEDFKPLVNFYEKIMQNPNEHSREQAFVWLNKYNFTLTPDGDVVGYKGVRKDADGNFVSIHAGPAIVNGESVNGHVPNPVGAVVEMARSNVQHDPGIGCHTGLHVGTWDYASGFAQGAVLEVHFNPRDIVSVPTDCAAQKVRTCRYKVVNVIDTPYETAVTELPEDEDEESVEVTVTFKPRRDSKGRFAPKPAGPKRDANGRFCK